MLAPGRRAEEKYKIKSIWRYAHKHLRSWLPALPSYKLIKGQSLQGRQRDKAADELSSCAVPSDSLWSPSSTARWINEKTQIQNASKVRPYQGLIVPVFGKIAAACSALT